jgi:hypothetical protein
MLPVAVLDADTLQEITLDSPFSLHLACGHGAEKRAGRKKVSTSKRSKPLFQHVSTILPRTNWGSV